MQGFVAKMPEWDPENVGQFLNETIALATISVAANSEA